MVALFSLVLNFHQECIIKWFLEKNKCPLCKKEYNFGYNQIEQDYPLFYNSLDDLDDTNYFQSVFNNNIYNNPISYINNNNREHGWIRGINNLDSRIENNIIERERDNDDDYEEFDDDGDEHFI